LRRIGSKSIAIRYSEQIAFFTAALIDSLSRLFRPVLKVLTVSNNVILRFFNVPADHEPVLISEDEVKY